MKLLDDIEIIIKREGLHDFSSFVMECIIEKVKFHSVAGNPQTLMDNYEDKSYKAVPAISLDKDIWEKYYKKLTPEEIEDMTKKLNMIVKIHNKRDREINGPNR